MRVFVTGASGFIGSHMADRMLRDGHTVVGHDDMSTSQDRFREQARRSPQFRFVKGDILDVPTLTAAMHGCDFVFHFAADADVRFGLEPNHWLVEARA